MTNGISKEPLIPRVHRGNGEFFATVNWAGYAQIKVQEFGITEVNLDHMKSSTIPVVQRILGTLEDTGKLLVLGKAWTYLAIKAVGNCGEMFERYVGPKSTLKRPRGLNNP